MYLLRYEKESLKDYIVYDMSDNFLPHVISSDNQFQICYLNNDLNNIRIYFKVIFYNKNIIDLLDKLLIFINEKFNTTGENWTILKNERMLDNDHIINLYFFSNKYCMSLSKLKKYIDNLYYSSVIFDSSIYYTFNSKYRELITVNLPNQSNNLFPHVPKLTILCGNPNDLVITNLENLVEFRPMNIKNGHFLVK